MRKKIVGAYAYIQVVLKEFSGEDILKFSASLAYYTVLSLVPLLIIIISICDFLFGKSAIDGHVYSQINGLVGKDAAVQIQSAISNIHITGHSFFATVISTGVLLFGATGIFGEVQDSLNKIWGLRIITKRTWWKLLLNRILSFSLILCIGFVLLVSLLLNAILEVFGNYLAHYASNFSILFLHTTDIFLSFLATTFLFSLMFKVLPDAKIKWKDVFIGGCITSLFFTLGKLAIGYYLGKSSIATVYGAAGSIMIIMIWIYYSSIILYLGAEFTKVYAKLYGGKILPNEYAEWIKVQEIHVANPVLKTNF